MMEVLIVQKNNYRNKSFRIFPDLLLLELVPLISRLCSFARLGLDEEHEEEHHRNEGTEEDSEERAASVRVAGEEE